MAVAFACGWLLNSFDSRRQHSADGSRPDYEGYIVSSVLGLLAILLGFTFSLAINRYEERRELVIAHANAIGAAYLRVQLLQAPHRQRLSRLLNAYTDTVIEITSSDSTKWTKLLKKDDKLITEIWAATIPAIDSVKLLPWSAALVDSINKLIDLDASRRDLRVVRLPTAAIGVLFIYVIGAAGVLGYVLAAGPGRLAGMFLLILMNLALLLIIDIDRPDSGQIRTDPFPLLQLRDTLGSQSEAAFDRWRHD